MSIFTSRLGGAIPLDSQYWTGDSIGKIKSVGVYMKKLLVLTFVFVGCVTNVPDYEAPRLIAPAIGSTHSTTVDFEWDQNNKADNTTGDYSFFIEIASDQDFKSIKDSYAVKVWSRYTTPMYTLRTGNVYWRVTATYIQNPTGVKTVKISDTWSFNYDGNDGAVYVNPSSTPVGSLGTKARPVQTIAEAFSISNKRRLTSINLYNDSYAEIIPQYIGYTVKGCFDAMWIRNISTCSTTISDGPALLFYQINN
jgi:hypothetical protein